MCSPSFVHSNVAGGRLSIFRRSWAIFEGTTLRETERGERVPGRWGGHTASGAGPREEESTPFLLAIVTLALVLMAKRSTAPAQL